MLLMCPFSGCPVAVECDQIMTGSSAKCNPQVNLFPKFGFEQECMHQCQGSC